MKGYEKLLSLANGKTPCTYEHWKNCRFWISQRFGYSADLKRLAVNLITIPGYGFDEIFKKVK